MTIRIIDADLIDVSWLLDEYGWQFGEEEAAAADIRISGRPLFDLAAATRALHIPLSGGIELKDFPRCRLGAHFLRHLALGGFGLCLRTDTAFALNCATLFTDALRKRLEMTTETWQMLDTGVHEAMANAIIHGNLALGSPAETTKDAFLQYCQTCDDRLADPAYAARRVEISALRTGATVEVAVRDHGDGFDPMALPRVPQAGGHGLTLIREMTEHHHIEDGGRCMVMVFRC